jgi:opacity protein-like surface antigen
MIKYLLLALGLILGSQVQATDLTLLAGYQFNTDFELSDSVNDASDAHELGEPGDDLELDGGAVLSLAVDFVFDHHPDQRIGFYLSHHQAQFDASAGLEDEGMDITHLHFTAMNYYPRGNWEPFVLAGIGVAHFSPDDKTLSSDTRVSAQIGAGANYKMSENLLLRLEARWIPTFFNGSSSGICSGGCIIALQSDTYSQVQANIGLQYRF